MKIHCTRIYKERVDAQIVRTRRASCSSILVVVIPCYSGTSARKYITAREDIILESEGSTLTVVEVDCSRTRTSHIAAIVIELQRQRAGYTLAFKAAVTGCRTIYNVVVICAGLGVTRRILFGVKRIAVTAGVGLSVQRNRG